VITNVYYLRLTLIHRTSTLYPITNPRKDGMIIQVFSARIFEAQTLDSFAKVRTSVYLIHRVS